MEDKLFRVPSECRNLISYFWELKQAACDELKQNGIDKEPAQAHFEIMQKICDKNPLGSLANYVRELKKGLHMGQEELVAYDQEIKELQNPVDEGAPLDFGEVDSDGDFEMLDLDDEDDFEMLDSDDEDDDLSWQHDVTEA